MPKYYRFALYNILSLWIIFFIYRVVGSVFIPIITPKEFFSFSFFALLNDLQMVVLILIPLMIILGITKNHFLQSLPWKAFYWYYVLIILFSINWIYIIDFYSLKLSSLRIDKNIFSSAKDFKTLWTNFPVVKILIVYAFAFSVEYFFFRKLYLTFSLIQEKHTQKRKTSTMTFSFLILFLFGISLFQAKMIQNIIKPKNSKIFLWIENPVHSLFSAKKEVIILKHDNF